MGDTKPPGKRWQATLAFPGVRIAQIGGGKPLVLCQGVSGPWPVVYAMSPSQDPHPRTVLVGGKRRPPLCARCAQRACVCSLSAYPNRPDRLYVI